MNNDDDACAVSVVVPCYDAAAYLAMALDSILGQTRPPAEVIVVDDGSRDGSAAITRGYGARVTLLHQANAGIAAARNRGVAHATGGLLAFLDADDLWPADSLARRCATLLETPSLGCVFGEIEQFSACGTRATPPRPGRLVGAMLARRAAFDRVGPFDTALRIGETIDWMARLDDSLIPCRMLDAVVLRRRIHATNTVRDPAKQADYLKALRASLHRRRAEASP